MILDPRTGIFGIRAIRGTEESVIDGISIRCSMEINNTNSSFVVAIVFVSRADYLLYRCK